MLFRDFISFETQPMAPARAWTRLLGPTTGEAIPGVQQEALVQAVIAVDQVQTRCQAQGYLWCWTHILQMHDGGA